MQKNKFFFISVLALVLFSLDRFFKLYFVYYPQTKIVFDGNLLLFQLLKNENKAFGLILNDWLFYTLLAVIFLILVYLLIDVYKKGQLYIFSCIIFIIIGAISNFIDRIRFGAVIDFINVPFWSVFNLADCYIVAGVIFWLIYLYKNERQIPKKN